MKYYIPIISHEYSNVLSALSVAPPIHYKTRNFGYNNLTPSKFSPFKNQLIAYDKPVFLTDNEEDNHKGFTINIEVLFEKEPILISKSKKGVDIFSIDENLLFNNNVKFIFENNSQINASDLIAKRALDSKFTVWAKSRQKTLEHDFSPCYFSSKELKTLFDGVPDSEINNNSLYFSQKLNKVFGTLLGFATGQLFNLNQDVKINIGELLILQNRLGQELKDNQLFILNRNNKVDKSYSLRQIDMIEELLKVNTAIQNKVKNNINVDLAKLGVSIQKDNKLKFLFCDDTVKEEIVLNHLINFFLNQIEIRKVEDLHVDSSNYLKQIGKYLKDVLGNQKWEKEFGDYRDFMLSLFKSIESQKYDHKIEDSHSDVIKSLSVLLTTGRTLDKYLDELIYKLKIKRTEVALSLYGAVYGFANMPKTLTNSFLQKTEYSESFVDIMNEVQRDFLKINWLDKSSINSATNLDTSDNPDLFDTRAYKQLQFQISDLDDFSLPRIPEHAITILKQEILEVLNSFSITNNSDIINLLEREFRKGGKLNVKGVGDKSYPRIKEYIFNKLKK